MRELSEICDDLVDLQLNPPETLDRCSDSDCNNSSDLITEPVHPKIEESSEEKSLPTFTLSEVSNHCTHDDCWIVVRDHVYDVTEFLQLHPGGSEIIMEHAGLDATFAFRGVGHSTEALDEMEQYLIGELVENEKLNLHLWRSSSIISSLSLS